jgi:hypothetical protein
MPLTSTIGAASAKAFGLTRFTGDKPIVTSSLRLSLEAFNPSSYSGSGTTWHDLSGNGFNATLVNGPTFSTDGGGSIVLDGSNDYISLSTNGFGAASFSLEWWIKKTAGDTDGYIHVTDSSDNPETRFYMSTTNFGAIVYDAGAYRWNTTTATITTDTWYHAVATVTNGSQKFYVNSVETATNSGFYDGSSNGSIGEHTIGTYNRPGAGYGGYWAGRIAAYRYYTKVLTPQEVIQNYNARKWRFGF